MAKATTRYVCQSCGAITPKWAGRCEACGEWNTIVEEASTAAVAKGRRLQFVDLAGVANPPPRVGTGIAELDRVLGGGFVPGSAILLAGDPGIGKSTLLLQAAARLARSGKRVLYISGEEAVDQVRLRARRLGLQGDPLELAASINLRDIAASISETKDAALVVIDSIQTMWMEGVESAPGSVSQVRASAFELIRIAKQQTAALVLVGHVTREGTIAGPRVLEHMVDAVLHFEGDRGHQFRILRGVKNRFGATDEIGVFEMGEEGLTEVANPSALFLAERRGNVSGSCVFAGLEGTRPVLVEIQALVAPSALGTPRRAVVGWDMARLNMVIAVLEARCGVAFTGHDLYLNVAGGLRIQEPAADLAVAAALVSALSGDPVPADAVVFGEIGLSGEVRAVAQRDLRLKEAAKLGFKQAWAPRSAKKADASGHNKPDDTKTGLTIKSMGHVQDVVSHFTDPAAPKATPPQGGKAGPSKMRGP